MAFRRGLLRLASASAPTISSRSACRASPAFTLQIRDFSVEHPIKEKAAPVKIPIQVYGVPGRYATSLYASAVRANKLEPVYEELNEVLKAADKSPTFGDFLKDMSMSNKDKVNAVRSLFKELGYSDIAINFLALLAENGRLRMFKDVMKSLSDLLMAYRKQVKATVTTVVELKQKEMDELKKSLKRFVGADFTIILEQKVDKKIMGGLVIEVGDKHIDLSVATKLRNMERVLREPLPDIV